jgi:hypothetical protein
MVSQQPPNRSDPLAGMTPKPGASAPQAAGGGTQSGAGDSSQGQQKAGEVADQAKQQAGQVVDQAKEQAGQVVDQAKEQATSQLSTQKDRAADSLGTVADALRQSGKHLRDNDQQGFAGYADKAAERVEQFSGQLRGKDVQEIVRDVERYARQQPAVFLGGAFVLGLLGARFLKSTAQREENDEGGDYRYDRYRPSAYAGSYRGQYARGGYGGQYPGGAATGGYGTRTGYAGGATPGEYSGQQTGGATANRPGAGGPGTGTGTGERSWSVRGTETR